MKGIPSQLFAEVTLYPTAQGGRKGPTAANWYGCPCKLNKGDLQAWDCRLLLQGRPLEPGDTRRVEIIFLSPEQAIPLFRGAGKFYLAEGRIVGEATII